MLEDLQTVKIETAIIYGMNACHGRTKSMNEEIFAVSLENGLSALSLSRKKIIDVCS